MGGQLFREQIFHLAPLCSIICEMLHICISFILSLILYSASILIILDNEFYTVQFYVNCSSLVGMSRTQSFLIYLPIALLCFTNFLISCFGEIRDFYHLKSLFYQSSNFDFLPILFIPKITR